MLKLMCTGPRAGNTARLRDYEVDEISDRMIQLRVCMPKDLFHRKPRSLQVINLLKLRKYSIFLF